MRKLELNSSIGEKIRAIGQKIRSAPPMPQKIRAIGEKIRAGL